MSSKMLIDAAHPEETRVVVVRGSRLEDFDYESATRKQLKGNIYLAKVTRVEPSLQAAFVDYGGNRHGFLAFNEIHPDYYQIPVADRQALLDEEAEEESKAQAEEAAHDDAQSSRRGSRKRKSRKDSRTKTKGRNRGGKSPDADESATTENPALEASGLSETVVGDETYPADADKDANDNASSGEYRNGSGDNIESVGQEDALEELPVRTRRRRNYKIQEVIKRRQIILVQVVKEERGNKGAALTTYISLAGRYTVLMPNTARGGGISRKITNATDRKRLRKIAADLDVTKGMGLIIRTAGASRTKAEIKRDFEYLLRMWENIRDLTLQSAAPTLVYEEGNLIKRSIRDLYDKEIEGVLVSGDEAYKEAKGFMKLLMPSHAKNVQPYKEPEPIFVRYKIEGQLGAMFSPQVTLKSGGYIVINQTEALVSIDVNSGKSTREHSIEDTALRTNLEAAEELSRQLRLRDLAGLIVIDFIDMEERRNNRSVERRLKDSLKNDRARIQVGRISHFGLMEMSRQRLRAGVLEGSTAPCTMCQGTGIVRSTESVALDILRNLEDTLLNEGPRNLVATASYDAALYILNQKRESVADMESRYNVHIAIAASDEFHGANFVIERGAKFDGERQTDATVVQMDESYHSPTSPTRDEDDEGGRKRSRRRRRRGRGDRDDYAASDTGDGEAMQARDGGDGDGVGDGDDADGREDSVRGEGSRRPRRRGRRGGRRTRGSGRSRVDRHADDATPQAENGAPEPDGPPADKGAEAAVEAVADDPGEAVAEDKPKRKRRAASTKSRATKTTKDSAQSKKPTPRARKRAAKGKDGDTAGEATGDAPVEPAPAQSAEQEGNGSTDWNAAPEQAPPKSVDAPKTPARDAPASQDAGKSGSGADDSSEASKRRGGWWQRRA